MPKKYIGDIRREASTSFQQHRFGVVPGIARLIAANNRAGWRPAERSTRQIPYDTIHDGR